uniref:DNA-directed DNA polymerase n=1 Tax=Romanomermis culicivorax TaxID=13658 RepID=A0A915K5M7_ROMCU
MSNIALALVEENNIKRLIRTANLESWYLSMYARPPKVLQPPTAQPTPNFHGYTLVSFDTESIMAADMKNFQFTVLMPADSTASSYLQYVQLTFPNGTMFVFETFAATPEEWTRLFSLVNGEHTIVVSFDGANDWVGIYALLGTQFRTNHQKKNKDPVLKVIHFDAYHVICNINISQPLYELARRIGVFPEKRTLKATVSAMWVLDVSKLTLKFAATLRFFNNPATSFLQSDVLMYAALDAYYRLLLFLAFGHYGFIHEAYNAPGLFPHDSLDATKINHLTETIIATFHNVPLSGVLPADSANRVYPTISQIALPPIMRDEVLSAYKFFMFDCTLSDHGWSFCLGTVPNGFGSLKVLRHTTHPKLLTTPKVPKKKKKKQKDEWNKSPDVSDDEDPALQPQLIFNDPKRLQAAVMSAMKSNLTDQLIELLIFPVSPMYKLAICDRL